MNQPISFSCTAMPQDKKGVLPIDENGYRTVVIGGLNVFNSAGHYYTYEGAKKLFESSSSFMRRVNAGVLHGELGHPKPLPGMDEDEYCERILTIEETNIACHYKEIWIDMESVRDNRGRPVIAILAKVKGAGPHAKVTEDSLSNPAVNTCFSIRSFTQDTFVSGVKHREIRQIVTFDLVMESGIDFARKYNAPGLEGRELHRVNVDPARLRRVVTSERFSRVGMESNRRFGLDTLEALGVSLDPSALPRWNQW